MIECLLFLLVSITKLFSNELTSENKRLELSLLDIGDTVAGTESEDTCPQLGDEDEDEDEYGCV